MTQHHQSAKSVSHSQAVTRDGKTVEVEILEDDLGGWILEVVDEHWNSTVWDEPFASREAALNEALRVIDEEGIDSLIGLPAEPEPEPESVPESPQENRGLGDALSPAELDELDDFLASEAMQDVSMDVAALDGFLAAIAIGPGIVSPSAWLPWVWDMEEGEAAAPFESEAQANRILSLVLRYYNGVLDSFSTDPSAFEPVFWRDEQWGAVEWCQGFVLGFQFYEGAWGQLALAQPDWFAPLLRLGTDVGIAITRHENDADRWANEIEPSLVRIHAYWTSRRRRPTTNLLSDAPPSVGAANLAPVVRNGAKIGRNAPCPCGSGKKFKACCGAGGAPSSFH